MKGLFDYSTTLLHHKGSASQTQAAPSTENVAKISASRSDVPAPPSNMAVGGQASLQPKRTPVSDKEIEAILVSENAQESSHLSLSVLIVLRKLWYFCTYYSGV